MTRAMGVIGNCRSRERLGSVNELARIAKAASPAARFLASIRSYSPFAHSQFGPSGTIAQCLLPGSLKSRSDAAYAKPFMLTFNERKGAALAALLD